MQIKPRPITELTPKMGSVILISASLNGDKTRAETGYMASDGLIYTQDDMFYSDCGEDPIAFIETPYDEDAALACESEVRISTSPEVEDAYQVARAILYEFADAVGAQHAMKHLQLHLMNVTIQDPPESLMEATLADLYEMSLTLHASEQGSQQDLEAAQELIAKQDEKINSLQSIPPMAVAPTGKADKRFHAAARA